MSTLSNIRNFSIIAHVDHGKSTLADRMLEMTDTISQRDMQEQLLDQMELERERGITIKMQPVRMLWKSQDSEFILNLIDTPGHVDFSYEVSRALAAVEGVVLLVDATQGIQAQTLSTLHVAKDLGLTIVPTVTKIDRDTARPQEVAQEIADVADISIDEVYQVSGKTGEGVEKLIEGLIEKVPAPTSDKKQKRGLVFDVAYSNHTGVIVYTRMFDGEVSSGDSFELAASGRSFVVKEVGVFNPAMQRTQTLGCGEIGFIETGIKEANVGRVGDTVRSKNSDTKPFPGYKTPQPVVWASVYPKEETEFETLEKGLERIGLVDAALSYSRESSDALGRGFRVGCLGLLHLEIITERLRREYEVTLVVTSPSVTYEVYTKDEEKHEIHAPSRFPHYGDIEKIHEPWVKVTILTPSEHLNNIMQLLYDHDAQIGDTDTLGGGRLAVHMRMPLRELMRGLFEDIRRVSSGYASLSYDVEEEMQEADVVVLEVLVGGNEIAAFSKVVAKRRVQQEAREIVEKLHELLPKQIVSMKIQAQAQGRVHASRTLGAVRKNVTEGLYGGDVTRKMKQLRKQKEGKKKLREHVQPHIPENVFFKMLKE